MIDRIRLTSAARSQLISLKRFSGIEHYNVLCRHALCLSLAQPTVPPKEDYNFSKGLDMDMRTLTGGNENLYLNLVRFRAKKDGIALDEQSIRDYLTRHLHRGLSYLSNMKDKNYPEFIAIKISGIC